MVGLGIPFQITVEETRGKGGVDVVPCPTVPVLTLRCATGGHD